MPKSNRKGGLGDFAALILSGGRPDNVRTYDSLRKSGYTGKIVVVVDDADPKLEAYRAKFPGELYVFSKAAMAGTFDKGDNFIDTRAVVYARNICWEVSRYLGVGYFIQLDDDYTEWAFRTDGQGGYQYRTIKDLNRVMGILLRFYKRSGALSIAIAQGGDFIGGIGGTAEFTQKVKPMRKCMNTWICSTSRPFLFTGRMNEDISASVVHGRRGELFLTMTNLSIKQIQTQAGSGGMTELYQESGTYRKSFYTVMQAPSCAKVSGLNSAHGGILNQRIHHKITWRKAAPCILRESLRKK